MPRVRILSLPGSRWEDFRRLRLLALKTDPAAFSSSLEEESGYGADVWKERMGNVLFAVQGEDPIGMVSVVFSERRRTRHVAFVHGFYVSRQFRGKGIGTMLMDAALSRVRKERRILKVELSVNPTFRPAVAIYKKAGFKVTGRSERELKVGGKFHDLLNMELHVR